MFEKLPTEVRFAVKPGASIYMPGRVTPTVVRGYGHITLSFESTDRPELLSIGIRDMHWRFLPFSIPVDVDRDGQLESIELHDIELNMNYLDSEASKGTLNLQTGHMEIIFEYVITPKHIPWLERLGGQTVKFTVNDRGWMDLRKGCFEIHSPVMGIKEWPLTGAIIKGGCGGCVDGPPPPPPSEVELSVVIQTPGAEDCKGEHNKSVTICPGDRIILCWSSSQDVRSVVLDPGSVARGASGTYFVTPPGPSNDSNMMIYRVRTVGGNTEAQDTVDVNFYEEGQWFVPLQAGPTDFDWRRRIPAANCSTRIEVQAVQLVRDGCLDWQKFLLQHYSEGAEDGHVLIEGFDPVDIPVPFRAAGDWVFTPQEDERFLNPPNPLTVKLPVCWRFRGTCLSG